MTNAVFEFPLNEKIRNYLRVESVFNVLDSPEKYCQFGSELSYFRELFTLLDLVERVDLKTEIIRDLKSYQHVLTHWASFEGVNKQAIADKLSVVKSQSKTLIECGKFGSDIKQDKFLMSIRQRMSGTNTTCSFDIPKLYYWLKQSDEYKLADMNRWTNLLRKLQVCIKMALEFVRERKGLTEVVAKNGFYQGVADNKSELIRIEHDCSIGYYPTLSGNRYRYSVRFLKFTNDDQSITIEDDIHFKMASC